MGLRALRLTSGFRSAPLNRSPDGRARTRHAPLTVRVPEMKNPLWEGVCVVCPKGFEPLAF